MAPARTLALADFPTTTRRHSDLRARALLAGRLASSFANPDVAASLHGRSLVARDNFAPSQRATISDRDR